MKRIALVFILLNFGSLTFGQTEYILGVIEYERRYGTEIEKAESRKSGFQSIKNESDRGYSDAQYYLATIYLSDTVYIDSTKAIELLKKSAFQRNTNAIKKLDELGVKKYEVQIDNKFWKHIGAIFLLFYLTLSIFASRKIKKSHYLTTLSKKNLNRQVWLFPIIGAILGSGKANKLIQPIDKEDINWVIQSFEWINKNFSYRLIQKKGIKTPKYFNKISTKQNKNEAKSLAQEIAFIMDIDKEKINVYFYKERQVEAFDEIEIRQFEDVESSTGKYFGMDKKGKYQISLEEGLLTRPTNLIATIAHELAHVKLLGEKRIIENDEYLTDLIPIAYGLGIFGANSIFNIDTNNYYWSMNRQGYLDENTYAFALAWYSSLREENNPQWKTELKPTVLEEFEKSMIYIENEIKQVTIDKK